MSLVQAIITENFVLVGADKKGIRLDGTIFCDFNKIIKLNKNIIIGCTGIVSDVLRLFEGYCNYSEEKGLFYSNNDIDISYNEFVNIINHRFKIIQKDHNSNNSTRKYNIGCLICGYNNTEFEYTTYNLGGSNGSPEGIFKATKAPNFPYKGVNEGKIFHVETLQRLVEDAYFKYGNLTMRQYKNILLEVFNEGAKIDDTINNIVCFESIRKVDLV